MSLIKISLSRDYEYLMLHCIVSIITIYLIIYYEYEEDFELNLKISSQY